MCYLGILHLGISDQNLIYTVQKAAVESKCFIEFRDFKKFKASNSLNDLHEVSGKV